MSFSELCMQNRAKWKAVVCRQSKGFFSGGAHYYNADAMHVMLVRILKKIKNKRLDIVFSKVIDLLSCRHWYWCMCADYLPILYLTYLVGLRATKCTWLTGSRLMEWGEKWYLIAVVSCSNSELGPPSQFMKGVVCGWCSWWEHWNTLHSLPAFDVSHQARIT